jgi:hypothetical protein
VRDHEKINRPALLNDVPPTNGAASRRWIESERLYLAPCPPPNSSRAATLLTVHDRSGFPVQPSVLIYGWSITPYGATGVPTYLSTRFSPDALRPFFSRARGHLPGARVRAVIVFPRTREPRQSLCSGNPEVRVPGTPWASDDRQIRCRVESMEMTSAQDSHNKQDI